MEFRDRGKSRFSLRVAFVIFQTAGGIALRTGSCTNIDIVALSEKHGGSFICIGRVCQRLEDSWIIPTSCLE